jgi:hypothetical protein
MTELEVLTGQAKANYHAFIRWKVLTHNGHRSRDEMTPEQQAEYDALGIKRRPPMTEAEQAEAKLLYDETTARLDG